MTYSEELKDPRWQKKRLEILDRDKWACKKCGDTETTLHVHHLKYEKAKNPWEYNKKDLVTLCENCHELIEFIKKLEDFDYHKCKIYKPEGSWKNGRKIMFLAFKNNCLMVIYNDKKWLEICQLKGIIPDMIKILKFAQNG